MARRDSGLDGILLVDKPAGWTSHDVVARVRRLTGQRRAGHTGTLDPFATGLLVVCLGRATRLVELLTAHDKEYAGEITLGATTDTDDSTGRTLAQSPVPPLDQATLDGLARGFTGVIAQVPPTFSAISTGGVRAYRLAREGRPVDLPARDVRVDHLRLTAAGPGRLRIEVRCGPGTYVRSLARDIGVAIGCGGHLSALRRLAVGDARVDDAASLETIALAAAEGRLDDLLLAVDDPLAHLPAAILDGGHSQRLASGQRLELDCRPEPAGLIRAYSTAGDFVALATLANDGILRAERVFVRANEDPRGGAILDSQTSADMIPLAFDVS